MRSDIASRIAAHASDIRRCAPPERALSQSPTAQSDAPGDSFGITSADRSAATQARETHRTAAAAHRAWGPGVKKMLQWGTLGCLVGAVQGYACTGYNPSADQYFQLAERNLTGVIHGWLSDCYDETYVCGTSCTTVTNSKGGSSTSCSSRYCTTIKTDEAPSFYVQQMASLVEGCGFSLVAKTNLSASQRVANALLERNHRVKVSVNRFNTSATTDPAVACLHNLK